jgi:16S rRNA (uracil1498-N3)-methyltransferase
VIVGPEGGITDEELAVLVAAESRPVRLGETVLRSSTAGVAALAVIASRTRWT